MNLSVEIKLRHFQLATDCRTQMQSQIESLAEELKRNEEAVERSREELRRAQQQEKVVTNM